jgi:signal transduction histidine kinase
MIFIQLLHAFFNFLGTVRGELLKTAVELIFFTIVTYMVISEWSRNRKKELKFLIIAFSTLVIDKLVTVVFLASYVFADAPSYFLTLKTVDKFFEFFALFLVVNAFVYPIIKQKKLDTKRFIARQFALVIGLSFIFSILLLLFLYLKGASLDHFWTNTGINVADVVVLLYYAFYIIRNREFNLNYRANIVAAFVIYSLTPVFNLLNIFLYDNTKPALTVAAHPWPFVSIMLFTQVIYLKLVDKAILKSKLRKSEQLYAHEKEVSKLKDEFISTVSHELKTPLTSMKLYTSMMKDGRFGKLSKKQVNALGVVNSETDRLNSLITDLLDLSRLDSKKTRLNVSEFDLNVLINNKLYINTAKKQGITTNIKIPKKFIVAADQDKIKQIFINLFNNAIKFTPQKGLITVSAKMLESEWEFSVADTGSGISKETIPKLFDKFYQGENYMTRTKGGFGLGLAIVKGLVELHKGSIKVESELGKGTTVSIKFPKTPV